MRRRRSEVGRRNGHRWQLVYMPRGQMQACEPEFAREWRWWLDVDGCPEGDFSTKAAALTHLAAVTRKAITA